MQYLKQEVRNRIMEAAKTEFYNNGFFDASIRNIAEMSDVSLGNIYRYFTDKEALFIAVCNDTLLAAVSIAENQFGFTNEQLDAFSEAISDFVLSHNDEIVILSKSSDAYKEYFISNVVNSLAQTLENYIQTEQPNVEISNPEFFDMICRAFLQSLIQLLSLNQISLHIPQVKELVKFFFGNLPDRFASLN